VSAERFLEEGLARPGDRVVLVHGSPLGARPDRSIRLHEIPHPSDRGPSKRYQVPV
jgi:pyruvate kinase